jgi:hypothetical protein
VTCPTEPAAGERFAVREVAPWVGVALAVWVCGVVVSRQHGPAQSPPPWQRSFLELTAPQQQLYRAIREGIFEIENRRLVTAGRPTWPSVEALRDEQLPPFGDDGITSESSWELRFELPSVTYLGTGAGLRWLVLFIEPQPMALGGAGDRPTPVDEEHHTLRDGTALHVTVWTTSLDAPAPTGVLASPVGAGWVQRVGR